MKVLLVVLGEEAALQFMAALELIHFGELMLSADAPLPLYLVSVNKLFQKRPKVSHAVVLQISPLELQIALAFINN